MRKRYPSADPEFAARLPNFGEAEPADWLQPGNVLLYDRTSPDRPGRRRRSPKWKRAELETFVRSKSARVAGYGLDFGRSGYRLRDRSELLSLLGLAGRRHWPILAYDWTRYGRSRSVLERLSGYGVPLVVFKPFSMSRAELQNEAKRRSQAMSPGGQPRHEDFDAALLALRHLSGGLRHAARKLNEAGFRTKHGKEWTHKQVRAVVEPYFDYRDDI